MRTRPLAVLVAFGVIAFSNLSMAQGLKEQPLYTYAVPFICGGSTETFQEGVVKGIHATAINIHNPSLQFKVLFNKKVSRSLPFQTSGDISEFEEHILDQNQAIEVECNEIRMKLPASMTTQFRSGFLVILSRHELDVVAVYTSRPNGGEVSTIDVQVIEPHKLSRADRKNTGDYQ